MSEENVFITDDDDDELDQLLERVQLEEPDSDGGNSEDNSSLIPSQVQLFAAVRSSTEEPRSWTSLALNEGSNGVRHQEGGPCQRPALSSTQTFFTLVELSSCTVWWYQSNRGQAGPIIAE